MLHGGYSEMKVFSLFRVFVTARCTFFDVRYGLILVS